MLDLSLENYGVRYWKYKLGTGVSSGLAGNCTARALHPLVYRARAEEVPRREFRGLFMKRYQ